MLSIRRISIFSLLLITIVFFSSCAAHKGLPYLKEAYKLPSDSLILTKGIHEARVMPNDIISITVSSDVPGAANDFNLPLVSITANQAIQTTASNVSTYSGTIQNYLVDKDGFINFPVLGNLKISGMTIKGVQEHITEKIYPVYISSKPIVTARFLNFNVSVLGEVAKPGIYPSENGLITILDALAAAGDMTIYGNRKNVLLVRILDDGELAFHNINLQDKNLALNKDLFFLQQNDKLYVQPNKARGNSSRFGTLETLSLSALSVIISVVAIATR